MFFNKFNQHKAELEALGRSQAVIHFTPDGIIVDANDNFLNSVGYTLAEIVGRSHRIFCEPSYTQSADYKDFWRKLAAGEFQVGQFKRLGKGGKEVWIEASYNPILDDAGKVIGIVKYAADITEQKLISADSEAQVAAIQRSQAVIQFHLNGTIISANENFLNVMGYTLDEIKGKHHSIFIDPAYAESDEYKHFWDRLNAGEFFTGEFRRFGKGGKEVWVEASYTPIMDMNGSPVRVVKYATDITKQKQRSIELRAQLEAINKSQAIIEFNLDGTIISANSNFLTAMGYTLAEIQGQHHRMFVDPVEANTPEYKAFWQKLARGEFDARVYKRIAKGGREIWIQASYNPILDDNGHPFKVIKFATDITQIIQTRHIAEETASNTQNVAAAVKQMMISIEEISKNMQLSKEATTVILNDSTGSKEAANQLNSSMQSMEKVVQMIKGVADQVNLLALNATIEAARAGDAGKGFAVVAAEVKNLANQTTKATEEIASQIQNVQQVAGKVAESINAISGSADKMNQYVTGVAGAIEEQSVVTREISHNTEKMAQSVEEIVNRIKRLSSVTL